jgi:hypothetical protein
MGFAKLCRLAGAMVLAGGVMAGAATAEDLSVAQWQFRAAFPCQSNISNRTVNSPIGPIIITLYTCSGEADAFLVAVNEYPHGTVRPENTDAVYEGIVNGMVSEVHGVVRSATPFVFGDITGREVLADLPQQHGVLKSHVLLIGDRLYQVTCVGQTGTDSGPRCAAFLNSFTLTDKTPASPPAK